MSVHDLIEQLRTRLPELEWKINQLPPNTRAWRMPKGLFQLKPGSPYHRYVQEVKKNIAELEHQTNPAAQIFLAKQIQQKIFLLIRLTVLQTQQASMTPKPNTVIKRLQTRQNQIHELEQKQSDLQTQIAALETRLSCQMDEQSKLNLRRDIGRANQKLTLLQEHLRSTEIAPVDH